MSKETSKKTMTQTIFYDNINSDYHKEKTCIYCKQLIKEPNFIVYRHKFSDFLICGKCILSFKINHMKHKKYFGENDNFHLKRLKYINELIKRLSRTIQKQDKTFVYNKLIYDKKESKEQVYKNGGCKQDKNKRQYSLYYSPALTEVVDVLMMGMKKYSRDNWKKLPLIALYEAFLRHFEQVKEAFDKNDVNLLIDNESTIGNEHFANIHFYIQAFKWFKDNKRQEYIDFWNGINRYEGVEK